MLHTINPIPYVSYHIATLFISIVNIIHNITTFPIHSLQCLILSPINVANLNVINFHYPLKVIPNQKHELYNLLHPVIHFFPIIKLSLTIILPKRKPSIYHNNHECFIIETFLTFNPHWTLQWYYWFVRAPWNFLSIHAIVKSARPHYVLCLLDNIKES